MAAASSLKPDGHASPGTHRAQTSTRECTRQLMLRCGYVPRGAQVCRDERRRRSLLLEAHCLAWWRDGGKGNELSCGQSRRLRPSFDGQLGQLLKIDLHVTRWSGVFYFSSPVSTLKSRANKNGEPTRFAVFLGDAELYNARSSSSRCCTISSGSRDLSLSKSSAWSLSSSRHSLASIALSLT